MLNILGRSLRLCDRRPRRHLMTIGSLAMGGITLPQLFYADVFATLYDNLDLNLKQATVRGLNGRPHYLAETREPIRELV